MYSVDDCLFEGEHAARKLMYQYQQMKRTIDKNHSAGIPVVAYTVCCSILGLVDQTIL